MRKSQLVIEKMLLVGLLLICLSTSYTLAFSNIVPIKSTGTIVYNALPLHVEGQYIKDTLGQTIMLKGVNYGAYNGDTDGAWEQKAGGTMEENFQAMRNWGANVWRAFICCSYWIDNIDDYRQNLHDAILKAGQYGIYVILCPWRVDDSIKYVGCPLKQGWTETDLANFWVSVMNELGDLPNLIVEVWNEPWDCGDIEWQSAGQAVVDAIREAGYEYIIIFQYNAYGTGAAPGYSPMALVNWHSSHPVNDSLGNLVIGTHSYGNFEGYGWSNQSDFDSLRSEMDEAQYDDVASQLDKPLMMTEGNGSPEELVFIENMLTIFDEWNIGYIAWTWSLNLQFYCIREGTKTDPSFDPNSQGEIWRQHFLGT